MLIGAQGFIVTLQSLQRGAEVCITARRVGENLRLLLEVTRRLFQPSMQIAEASVLPVDISVIGSQQHCLAIKSISIRQLAESFERVGHSETRIDRLRLQDESALKFGPGLGPAAVRAP